VALGRGGDVVEKVQVGGLGHGLHVELEVAAAQLEVLEPQRHVRVVRDERQHVRERKLGLDACHQRCGHAPDGGPTTCGVSRRRWRSGRAPRCGARTGVALAGPHKLAAHQHAVRDALLHLGWRGPRQHLRTVAA